MTADEPAFGLPLEERLGLAHPVQRLAYFAELRQYPRGGGDRPRKKVGDVPSPKHCDPALD